MVSEYDNASLFNPTMANQETSTPLHACFYEEEEEEEENHREIDTLSFQGFKIVLWSKFLKDETHRLKKKSKTQREGNLHHFSFTVFTKKPLFSIHNVIYTVSLKTLKTSLNSSKYFVVVNVQFMMMMMMIDFSKSLVFALILITYIIIIRLLTTLERLRKVVFFFGQ